MLLVLQIHKNLAFPCSLVRGLDILQGEENCFYGTLLPTLVTIIKMTKATSDRLLTMTTGLVYAVENSIKQRFSGIFDSKNAIISAMTLPKFKLKWVEIQSKKDQYTQMLLDEMRQCIDVDDFSEDVVAEDDGKEKDKTGQVLCSIQLKR